MRRLFSRTSITTDEAVANLLGLIDGPIDFKPKGDSEEAEDFSAEVEANRPAFCLRETLEDELEVLDGEYRLAKRDKRSAHVIAEKLAALQSKETTIEQANRYLCAIEDELNKGEQSTLKVDRALSNAAYTYITWHSFNEWTKRKDLSGHAPGAIGPAGSVLASANGPKKKEPEKKGIQQEDAMLDEIRRQGFNPMALPPNPSGKRGVAYEVRKALATHPLFQGKSAFKRTWQDLSAKDLIAYKTGPSSPKKVDKGDL